MGFFSKAELTVDNMMITTSSPKSTTETAAKYFICVEDANINGTNIKEYILEELKKHENCNTLCQFRRTPFGFTGIAAHRRP